MYEVTEVAEIITELRGALYALRDKVEAQRGNAPLDFDLFNKIYDVIRTVDYVEDLFEPIEFELGDF